jgi:hypothetical protein
MPLVQPALTAGMGHLLVQTENFRKKFRIPPIQQMRVPFKHAAPLPSSHFSLSAQARKHLFRTAFPLLGYFQKLLRHKRCDLLLVGQVAP